MLIQNKTLDFPFLRHAFFTRQGGVSEGEYQSLNCRLRSTDKVENIRKNRAIALQKANMPENSLITLEQSHSATVLLIEKPPAVSVVADAMVTKTQGLTLGILTADCVPILLVEPKHHIIAAIHAGWRGACHGIIQNTLNLMQQQGGQSENIVAVIGPCIQQSSYEVGPEFPNNFTQSLVMVKPFLMRALRAGHYLFDLPAYVAACLKKTGIQKVQWEKRDTFNEDAHFFSYRRSFLRQQKTYGCQLSAICLV